MRTIQKLSLIYGFEFNTDDEIAELWIAAASAAGVDISRELLEKEVVNKFVPRVIQRIAARASTEVVEKWAGRVIPLASSAIGAGLNYWFVRAWGEPGQGAFPSTSFAAAGAGAAGGNYPAGPGKSAGAGGLASAELLLAEKVAPLPPTLVGWRCEPPHGSATVAVLKNKDACLFLLSHSF